MYITKQSIARTKCIMSRPTYNVEMKKKSRRDTTSTAETGTRYLYRKHISCLLIWYLRFNKKNMDTIGCPWILVTTTSKSVYFTYLQDKNNPYTYILREIKKKGSEIKGLKWWMSKVLGLRIYYSGFISPMFQKKHGWHYLVGGWTNPFEKYARQIESLPQISGWK